MTRSPALILRHIKARIVLVALQVIPVFNEFVGLELVRGDQVTVFAAGVRHSPVVEEKLIWWWHWVDPQLGQADSYIHILEVKATNAQRGIVDFLRHVPREHIARTGAKDRISLAGIQLWWHVPLTVLVAVGSVASH